jgi:ferredoxin
MADVLSLEERAASFRERVKSAIPGGGNLDMCMLCGTCVSGCPASGLAGMDPRKFVRMVILGLDEEVLSTPWVWMCTQCQRCIYACPMEVDIPKLVYEARASWPRDQRPKGIRASCDHHVQRGGAMGIPKEDWIFVVQDVLADVRSTQPGWENLEAPIDKKGAPYYLNQNSREPVTEPEEMVPLWKILHLCGIDWTYSSEMWGGENYCMFLADDDNWARIIAQQARIVDELGCHTFIETE